MMTVSIVDVGDVGADAVQEVAVVRDDDQGALVAAEVILQPVDGIEIEVVGRLVEQQRRRIAEQRLREQHADLLAALQFAHLALVQRVFDAEAVEQDGGVGLGGVAALFADDAFEFAEAHAVFVGQLVVGLGVERVALCRAFQSGALPMITVSITRNSSKANWSWRRTPSFLGRVTEPLVGSISPVQDLHQSGLAGAVRTGDGIAAPRQERAGDVFEQSSGAEAHGDVVEGKQR